MVKLAASPSHRFGQIVGEVLELAVHPLLKRFATTNRLYLDRLGKRDCRPGKKCTWVDRNGNAHDLDYVLERNGSGKKLGTPVAFIETAWRRYTKHSRNKAQEIQGAIVPLFETYRAFGPFMGAILAGVFTQGALAQLRSLGFVVLYFPYESVVAAFSKLGIDAQFDETTPDDDFASKINGYQALSAQQKNAIARRLLKLHSSDVETFIFSLQASIDRVIERVLLLPLHGIPREVSSISEAIGYLTNYPELQPSLIIHRYEIQIKYGNGDRIDATFREKAEAIRYLNEFIPPAPPHSP